MALRTTRLLKMVSCFVLVLGLTVGSPLWLHAQSSFGTVKGVVTDASEAAVPGATVTVTNTKTNIARQVTTNESGIYQVGSLIPGAYTIKAEKSGFQVSLVPEFELRVDQVAVINIPMKVGEVSQTVDVTAAAPLLENATSTMGTVVDNNSVVELPLNGRSFVDLIMLVPGSVPRGKLFAISGGANYSVSGLSPDQNAYTLDGMSNNEMFFKSFAIQPSIDAIQEFKVQTHVSDAQYGSGAGANVNVSIKSGTNALHGTVFEFLRNKVLDANDFFRNSAGIVRPNFSQNQYGFTVGGPFYIPKVYDGRNKAFWFFNYEGYKIRRQSSILATVPTSTLLGGDFRGQAPIYDPETRRLDSSGNLIADPFPNNIIPGNRINPAIAAWANIFYPKTTTPGANNVINTNSYQLNQWQLNGRADYKFNDKLNMFFRYSYYDASQLQPQPLPVVYTQNASIYKNGVLSLSYVPTPTWVLDFKIGVNYTNTFQSDTDPAPGAAAYLQQYPLQGTPIKNPSYPLYPYYPIPGYTGASQSGVPLPVTDYSIIFNATKIMGKHSLKFGMTYDNFRGSQDNFFTSSFSFSSALTADPLNQATTGDPVASFLLGYPASGSRNIGDTLVHMRWRTNGYYFQDDYKVTSKLTLNLGIRWEYDQVPRDRDNRLGQFDRVSGQFVWAGVNPVNGAPANIGRAILSPDYNNWAPRIGIAYQLRPKTVLRTGYNIFYNSNFLWESQGIRGQWPYALSDNPTGTNTGLLLRPIQTYFSPDLDVTPDSKPSGIFALGRDDRTGYTQQWNFGIQHELAQNLLLDVSYVGTRSIKSPVFFTTNTPVSPGPGPIDLRRPFPQSGSLLEDNRKASGNYNGLQVKLDKRFSQNLQFLVTYAWAHQLDMGGNGNSDGATPQNEYNLKADYASGAFDVPQIFTASWLYQLPFGKGQRYMNSVSGVVNQFVGGWELTGITRYTSGLPYTVNISFDNANTGSGGQRPNRILGQSDKLPINATDKTQGWLNPAAFEVAPQYTFGNLGRNTERGPGFGDWILGIYKNFPLPRESMSLQFRTEFFNAFNNVNLSLPTATFGTPGFGTISSTVNPARQIQFGLKFRF